MSVTHKLWITAGKPSFQGENKGVCRVCGKKESGLLFNSWVKPTFTDLDKMKPGTIICHACQFSFCERSELLSNLVEKEKPQRMRNYSHFVVDGKWIPLSKGNKEFMRDILLNKIPDVAIIAESGKKHIIFRAVPGIVQFEETQIRNLSVLEPLLEKVEKLYNGGFSKTEIQTGNYNQYKIIDFGLDEWNLLERALLQFRQSSIFSLALFLSQKET